MMKPTVFNPAEIEEINFRTGRDRADPVGCVRVPQRDELLLLHYKYLGFDRTYARHRQLLTGLRSKDIENKWGHKYLWSREELARDWKEFAKQAVDVRQITSEVYPIKRWWLPRLSTVNVEAMAGDQQILDDDTASCGVGTAAVLRSSGNEGPSHGESSKAAFETATEEHRIAIAPELAIIDADIARLAGGDSGSSSTHPHDLPAEACEIALASSERPDLLQELMKISRETFGFYTRHFPHTINYTWAAKALEFLAAGSRGLDVGAGLSPLPLFLAKRGVLVDCVDNHHLVRALPPQPDWNEWRYFDYRSIHSNVSSHYCDIFEFMPFDKYDAIYSIDGLAHMFAAERRRVLGRVDGFDQDERARKRDEGSEVLRGLLAA